MKLNTCHCICFLFFTLNSIAQSRSEIVSHYSVGKKYDNTIIRELKIGDKLPNFWLRNIVNFDTLKQVSIYEIQNKKLMILDFWSVWCSVCIAQFPKLQSLQNKFKSEIVIVGVGFDSSKKNSIKQLIEHRRGTPSEIWLPTIIQAQEDTLFQTMFPFSGLPHEVWINNDGYVIGITDHLAITEDNIRRLLNGEKLEFSVNKVVNWLDPESNFLIPRRSIDKLNYGSAITSYIDSLSNPNPFGRQYDSLFTRLFDVNQTVFVLYGNAYSNEIPELRNIDGYKRIIIESNKFQYQDWNETKGLDNWGMDKFRKENVFSYELVLPKTISLQYAYKRFSNDLDDYFDVKSMVEERNVKCYELRIVNKQLFRNTRSDSAIAEVVDDLRGNIHLKNVSIPFLIDYLNGIIDSKHFIVDGIKTGEHLSLSIPKSHKKVMEVNKVLNKIGLEVVEKVQQMKMLVIKDRNFQ